jgi:GntR family transcriptional regulator, transcriptional repressor for pyruvate dehydrogenase complex
VNTAAPLPESRLARREPANIELANRLLQYLMSGKVAPGQRLPGERSLSEALGVGRAALREALKSLSLLGILEQRQGDGTYLSSTQSDLLPKVVEWGLLLGDHEVSKLVDARHHLEVLLAGLAAERRGEGELAALRAAIQEMRDATGDLDRYINADVAFHLEIANASGNDVLGGVLHNISSLLRVWTERVIYAAGEAESSLAMHEPIFEAIEAKSAAKARKAMVAHMVRARRRLNATIDGSLQDQAILGHTARS